MPWFFHLLNSDNDSIYFTGLCKINKLAHLISALLTVPITAHMQKILPIMIPTLKCHTHNQGSFCCRSVWWPGMIPIHTRDSFYKHCFLKQVSMSYLREFPNCWIFFFFLHPWISLVPVPIHKQGECIVWAVGERDMNGQVHSEL